MFSKIATRIPSMRKAAHFSKIGTSYSLNLARLGQNQKRSYSNVFNNKSNSTFATLSVAALVAAPLLLFWNTNADEGKEEQKHQGQESATKSQDSAQENKEQGNPQDDVMEFKYVIVGAGTAGYAALKEIQSLDPDAKILIIGEENHLPYRRPPLSKDLWNSDDPKVAENLQFKDWSGASSSVWYQESEAYKGVTTLLGVSVSDLDAERKLVLLKDGRVVGFERLLIATGVSPRKLPGVSKELSDLVSTYRGIDDFRQLDKISKESSKIIVVGGGFLGSELACALARRGQKSHSLQVTQVFPEVGMMGFNFPKYLSEFTTNKMKSELGLEILPGNFITEVKRTADNKLLVKLSNGSEHTADHMVVAVGTRPNTYIADMADLEVDPKNGGIVTNIEFQARTGIWAAGDVVSYPDSILGRRRMEHHDHAVESGKFAGRNMVLADKGFAKPYTHQPFFWGDLGSIAYEAIGNIDANLRTVSVWDKNGEEKKNFTKGIIYYLDKEDKIVGAVCWGLFGKTPEVARLMKRGKPIKDLTELKNAISLEEEHH